MGNEKQIGLNGKVMETTTLTTTLGELICAISDAAEESAVDQRDLATITQIILRDMLRRNC